MVDSLEHSDLCLWNSGHHPSADDLFRNRACHRLPDFGRRIGGFLWQVLVSLLYAIAAICLLVNPLLGILSLSLLLAIFLLLEGILEFALYFRLRRFHHSIWLLIDGIGTSVLGILMLSQWPPASPEIIGALIGISLMLSAVSRLIFTMAIRALNPATA
jgi:uncharacterized membrane protein HdeD (DUF308 family)